MASVRRPSGVWVGERHPARTLAVNDRFRVWARGRPRRLAWLAGELAAAAESRSGIEFGMVDLTLTRSGEFDGELVASSRKGNRA